MAWGTLLGLGALGFLSIQFSAQGAIPTCLSCGVQSAQNTAGSSTSTVNRLSHNVAGVFNSGHLLSFTNANPSQPTSAWPIESASSGTTTPSVGPISSPLFWNSGLYTSGYNPASLSGNTLFSALPTGAGDFTDFTSLGFTLPSTRTARSSSAL